MKEENFNTWGMDRDPYDKRVELKIKRFNFMDKEVYIIVSEDTKLDDVNSIIKVIENDIINYYDIKKEMIRDRRDIYGVNFIFESIEKYIDIKGLIRDYKIKKIIE
jgi:hypothetical protein